MMLNLLCPISYDSFISYSYWQAWFRLSTKVYIRIQPLRELSPSEVLAFVSRIRFEFLVYKNVNVFLWIMRLSIVIIAVGSKIVMRLGWWLLVCKKEHKISYIVNNSVTATRLVNKTAFANTELINTSIQQVGNNIRESFRIGVKATKKFHETTNEVAK